MSQTLMDPAAERGVLAGICQHGGAALAEVEDLLTSACFSIPSNQLIYRCLAHQLTQDPKGQVDLATFFSSAQSLHSREWFNKVEELDHLRAVMNCKVELRNLRKLGAKVRKLALAREARQLLGEVDQRLTTLSGDESIDHILGVMEQPLFDFSRQVSQTEEGTTHIGQGLLEWVQHLIDHPVDQVGLSVGYPLWEQTIGGGLRRKSVNVVAARTGEGKAQWNDCLVYTPYGPKPIGDVVPGDRVCGPDGEDHRVQSIHPQGAVQLYEVTADNGDSTFCCRDHLWLVRHPQEESFKVRTLWEIRQEKVEWELPLPAPANFRYQPPPLDPWLFGLTFAAGSWDSRPAQVRWSGLRQPDSVLDNLLRATRGKSIAQHRSSFALTGEGAIEVIEKLVQLGLDPTGALRTIPPVFLYNSPRQRSRLLAGLLAAGGRFLPSGEIRWYASGLRPAKQVKKLIQSMGGVVYLHKRSGTITLRIFHPNPAQLLDHNHTLPAPPVRRFIQRTRRWERQPATCLKLASREGTYLTDHYLVTHNTFFGDNAALHATANGVKVLMLDTEMSKDQHWARMLANLSGVNLTSIEQGSFTRDPRAKELVLAASAELAKRPYHYRCISGYAIEESLAVIRRWLMQDVGLDENGQTNPCLVIYDYIKLMDSTFAKGGLSETQAFGFILTAMHDFAVKYDLPVLAFAQTNRAGIHSEELDAIAASDRVAWLASNVTLLKMKDETEWAAELAKCGPDIPRYEMKLVPLKCRHGKKLARGDYINIKDERDKGILREGPTRNQLFFQHKPQGQSDGTPPVESESTTDQSPD